MKVIDTIRRACVHYNEWRMRPIRQRNERELRELYRIARETPHEHSWMQSDFCFLCGYYRHGGHWTGHDFVAAKLGHNA